ncbi:hypothetical protein D3C72_1102080 [compost metagenome]
MLVQQFRGGNRYALGQRRQNARRPFEQRDAHILDGVEILETIRRIHAARFAQFGRQLHTRGAAADDDDVDTGMARVALALLGHGQQFQQGQTETFRVFRGIEGNRVFLGARHAEVIRRAAHGQHQLVVADCALRQELLVLVRGNGAHGKAVRAGVERDQGTIDIGKTIVMRQHLVRQALLMNVQGAGRHFMQRRFPDVVQAAVDQGDLAGAELAAEFAGQLQAACTSSYDNDFTMQISSCLLILVPVASAITIAIAIAMTLARLVIMLVALAFMLVALVIMLVVVTAAVAVIGTAMVAMLLAITGHILVVIPTILDEIYLLVAGIILAAVLGPVLGMARRHAQVDRTGRIVLRALHDDGLGIDQLRRGIIADIEASVKAWLADGNGDADLGDGGGGCRQQGGSKNQGFHGDTPFSYAVIVDLV